MLRDGLEALRSARVAAILAFALALLLARGPPPSLHRDASGVASLLTKNVTFLTAHAWPTLGPRLAHALSYTNPTQLQLYTRLT